MREAAPVLRPPIAAGRPLRRVSIAGVGASVPEKRLTNHDLERLVETSDDWIFQRTGIRERRMAPEGVLGSDLGADAARRALEQAGVEAREVDLIVVATITPDYVFPNTSCNIQEKLGARRAAGFDVSQACTGFINALSIGWNYVATGAADTAVVVGAEILTRITDYQDRGSCILFGDGAGAVVLRPDGAAGEILHCHLEIEGGNYDVMNVPAGGAAVPASHESVEQRLHFMRLKGREVYRFAVNKLVDLVRASLALFPGEELGLIVPHQVNGRIIESAMEKLELPMDRVAMNIDRYGNTSSASIPLALDEWVRAGKVPKGKLVVFVAFGAGLSWGSAVVRW